MSWFDSTDTRISVYLWCMRPSLTINFKILRCYVIQVNFEYSIDSWSNKERCTIGKATLVLFFCNRAIDHYGQNGHCFILHSNHILEHIWRRQQQSIYSWTIHSKEGPEVQPRGPCAVQGVSAEKENPASRESLWPRSDNGKVWNLNHSAWKIGKASNGCESIPISASIEGAKLIDRGNDDWALEVAVIKTKRKEHLKTRMLKRKAWLSVRGRND